MHIAMVSVGVLRMSNESAVSTVSCGASGFTISWATPMDAVSASRQQKSNFIR